MLDRFPPVERFDLSNGRWYSPPEEEIYYPSSTTVLNVLSKGIGYEKWLGNSMGFETAMKYARDRAQIGTCIHEMVQTLLNGGEILFKEEDLYRTWWDADNQETVDITQEHVKYMLSFEQLHKDLKLEPIATELAMFHPELPWSGAADFVGYVEYKGEREFWLIDWKTGQEYKREHQLQLTSYLMLWRKHVPELTPRIAAAYLKSGWRKKPNYTIRIHPPMGKEWLQTLNLYQYMNNNPQPNFGLELPNSLTLEQEDEVQLQDK